jgi:tRNA pseudouridine13 synthase
MKLRPGCDHFQVTELPAYAASGEGEHLYLWIEKEDLTTDQAVDLLAKAFGINRMGIGYAGRKDRQAITRQWFSLLKGDPARIPQVTAKHGRLTVLEHGRHKNKIRLGHLAGNRFRLGIEGVADPAALTARLAELAATGIRNRFGPQRFGLHQSSLSIATAWGQGDHESAVARCVDPAGGWRCGDPLPEGFRQGPEGRVLGALRRGAAPGAALKAGGEDFRKLIASAAQSAIFNAVLDAREAAGLLHAPEAGDICRTSFGAPFRVTADDLASVCERCTRLDAILTGPLPGAGGLVPDADRLDQERTWSASTGMDWSWFTAGGPFESPGERRPLLIPFLEPPSLEPADGGHWLSFALPSGAYATEVLAQVGVGGR